jgi:hypothetical protein
MAASVLKFSRAGDSVPGTRLEQVELSRDPLEEFLSFDCNEGNRYRNLRMFQHLESRRGVSNTRVSKRVGQASNSQGWRYDPPAHAGGPSLPATPRQQINDVKRTPIAGNIQNVISTSLQRGDISQPAMIAAVLTASKLEPLKRQLHS